MHLDARTSAASDEEVFAAVVSHWLLVEGAVERFKFKPRDIEQAEPFFFGCPPQRAGLAIIERDVDPVVAHRVPNRVRHRFVPVPPVYPCRGLMVEREDVPSEPPTVTERRRDALECTASIALGRQMEARSERAIDQRSLLVELEVAHVPFAKIKLHPRLGSTSLRLFEHPP